MANVHDLHALPQGFDLDAQRLLAALRRVPGHPLHEAPPAPVTFTVAWQASFDGETWLDMKPIETVIRKDVEQSLREADDARFTTEIAAEVGSK